MAGHAREGSQFNAWSSPFFPISRSHTGHQSGSSEPGQQEFNLYSFRNTNDPLHSPNLPGPLSPYLLKTFLKLLGLPGITYGSHCPLDREAGAMRESKSLKEKYSFKYRPRSAPHPHQCASFCIWPLLQQVVFDNCGLGCAAEES